ncbi:hypothetical protein PMI15_04349 [Polaromonas sp. CF318]|uniref:DUF6151 family protein n=1 Tax=Polaromonas sp. CF318 TaxID=1144318 RepID=UPI00027101A6|nr:DUF6151 family protein [Polaromonas sp. CF318]EJL78500.1 hypothetical protein PMI15_04349 [Polaromonas sp. CF318]
MTHPLRCQCGTLQGHVSHTESVCRGVCYCKDCQAYAHFLGKADEILDEMGGSDVVATLPQYVSFTQGVEKLTCMSLSDKGMLRWYASCCNTPIGNTSRDFKVSHVGLLHNCLQDPSTSLDSAFGPVRMRVGMKSAKGTPKAMAFSTTMAILQFMGRLVRARLDGSYRKTPFFDPETGAPRVSPKVLTPDERARLMQAV